MFSPQQLNVIEFCAHECSRQGSGELSVYRMVDAYDWAASIENVYDVTEQDVLLIGKYIEPTENQHGYRQTPVTFRDGTAALDWRLIPHAMEKLLASQRNLTAEEFYQEFEAIHPFVDGNGRVGAILYNFFAGTLWDPMTPPEFKR